jgi:hypothetical protein
MVRYKNIFIIVIRWNRRNWYYQEIYRLLSKSTLLANIARNHFRQNKWRATEYIKKIFFDIVDNDLMNCFQDFKVKWKQNIAKEHMGRHRRFMSTR